MAYADIELKRNDTWPFLDSTLSDDNGALDLTGCTIKFFMVDSEGNTVINQTSTGAYVTLPSATAGQVRYYWQAADTSTSGNFKAEWSLVHSSDSSKGTVPNGGNLTVIIFDDLDST